MEETTQTIDDNAPPLESGQPSVEPPVSAEPKKKGRPAGAKDRAPRKKKITIVEEPLRQALQELEEASRPEPLPAAPSVPAPEEEEPPEPDSPRTGLINAQRKFHDSIHGVEGKRARAHDVYIKRLASTHQLTACR